MMECLKLSQRLLTLSSFFGFFFLLAILIGCFLLPYVPIIDVIHSFLHCSVDSLYIILYFNYYILHFCLDLFYAAYVLTK